MLTAFSESDFRSDATQKASRGVFQQTLPWWPTAGGSTAEQCRAFLAAFARIHRSGDLVADCWQVQQWAAPNPLVDMAGFLRSNETINYLRRVDLIPRIISEGRLP